MSGIEIIGTLVLFLVIRFVFPAVIVYSVGNLLRKSQPA
jgi:hypothetical protein